MALQALVLSSLVLAAPAAPQPAPSQAQIWELAVSLSAGVVYRMDSMPARLHKPGDEFLQDARRLANQLSLPLPSHAVLDAAEADTVEAMGYLLKAKEHPAAQALERRNGHAAAALFEFGLLTHLAMTAIDPASESARSLADQVEAAARESGVARDSWAGFVDALRSGKTKAAAKEAMAAMLPAVGKACSR